MQLCELKLEQIYRTAGNNPRIINEKSEGFIELVNSIKAIGVKEPIHVREKPIGKNHDYELLAGERRYCAADMAGLETIPALNHGELTDEAAFEITFAENYAREDLTVLEQGKAVATLLIKYKGDAAAVASKMGKSLRWVMQRSAIHQNLAPVWRQALIKDPDLKDWTASHLQLVAAMPQNIQDDIYQTSGCDTPTVKELEKDIAGRMKLLANAPWDKEDPKLVKGTGACSKCTRRSSCQPGLFDETTEEETIKKNDRCLDEECWNAKVQSYIKLKAAELRAKHKDLIYAVMPDEYLDYSDKGRLASQFGEIAYQWKKANEGEKGTVPALIVYGKNAGELRWVKFPTNHIGKTPKGCESKKPTPLAEREKLLEKKRWFAVVRELIGKIEKSPVGDIVAKDSIFTVMALTAAFGTTLELEWREKGNWSSFDKIKTTKDALDKLWAAVLKTICNNLTYCGPITQTPDELIESAKRTAELLGIDINKMFKEVAENEYPEPKTWANLKADGTPKEKQKAKSKNKKSDKTKSTEPKKCRICECTEDKPCMVDTGMGVEPCHWMPDDPDLCSACAAKMNAKAKKAKKTTKAKTSKSGDK